MYVILCFVVILLFNFDFDVCFTHFSKLAPKKVETIETAAV